MEVTERFAVAVQEWADQTAPSESSRCWGEEPTSSIGRTNSEMA